MTAGISLIREKPALIERRYSCSIRGGLPKENRNGSFSSIDVAIRGWHRIVCRRLTRIAGGDPKRRPRAGPEITWLGRRGEHCGQQWHHGFDAFGHRIRRENDEAADGSRRRCECQKRSCF